MTVGAPRAKQSSLKKKRPLTRGEPVVRCVLEAALAELSTAGYGALRVEDVATRAGVNKTTVYRRWPTKEDLVRAALQSITVDRAVTPNTGSLRGDLLEIGRHLAARASSPEWQGIRRALQAEGQNAELMAIAKSLREALEAVPRSLIEAAEARGEIEPSADAMLLFNVLKATVQHRIYNERKEADEGFLSRVIDLLLHGALSPQRRAPSSGAPA
jgi:AcrR family transcriptional regulator